MMNVMILNNNKVIKDHVWMQKEEDKCVYIKIINVQHFMNK